MYLLIYFFLRSLKRIWPSDEMTWLLSIIPFLPSTPGDHPSKALPWHTWRWNLLGDIGLGIPLPSLAKDQFILAVVDMAVHIEIIETHMVVLLPWLHLALDKVTTAIFFSNDHGSVILYRLDLAAIPIHQDKVATISMIVFPALLSLIKALARKVDCDLGARFRW